MLHHLTTTKIICDLYLNIRFSVYRTPNTSDVFRNNDGVGLNKIM